MSNGFFTTFRMTEETFRMTEGLIKRKQARFYQTCSLRGFESMKFYTYILSNFQADFAWVFPMKQY